MPWVALHPQAIDFLGYVISWLDENDPRPAREQLDANYRHGGGWHPLNSDQLTINPETGVARFVGDPPYIPVAFFLLRDEKVYCYPHECFSIVQKDGTFEFARMS